MFNMEPNKKAGLRIAYGWGALILGLAVLAFKGYLFLSSQPVGDGMLILICFLFVVIGALSIRRGQRERMPFTK
jgi:hypothetical protein